MHILFLAGSLGQGGAERQLFYILKTLKAQGADVSLACLTKGDFWEEPIKQLGVPVYWVGGNKNHFIRLAKIIALARKNKSTIIQSHHFFTNAYSTIAARVIGIRDIGAIRSDAINEVRANGNIFGNFCLHAPGQLAANSKAGIDNAVKKGVPSQRLYFLPNVVESEHFSPSVKTSNKPLVFLTVGSLIRPKRHDLFIECFSRVKAETRLNIQGWIVGEGPLQKSIEAKINILEMENENLKLFKKVADPLSFYNQADIFLLTSDFEGTPNVVMEAMSCGLPVIATRTGGTSDLIKDGETGYLVNPGDIEDIVMHLHLLLEKPELRMKLGTAARQFIVDHYSINQLPMMLEEFYNSIYRS